MEVSKIMNLIPQILGQRVLAERVLDIRVDMFICQCARFENRENVGFVRDSEWMDRDIRTSKWVHLRISRNIVLFGILLHHTRIVGLRSCKPARVPPHCDYIHNRDMFYNNIMPAL